MKFNCAKCGKDAHNWRSIWSHRDFFPEFRGKRICPDCITELNSKRLNAFSNSSSTHETDSLKKCSECAFSRKTTVQVEKENLTNLLGAISQVQEQ